MNDQQQPTYAQAVAERGVQMYKLLHMYDHQDCINLYHGDGALPPHPVVKEALKAVSNRILVWNSALPEVERPIELQRYRVPTEMTINALNAAILKDFAKTMPSHFDVNDATINTAGGVTHIATALFNYFRKTNAPVMMFAPTYTSFLFGASTVSCEVILIEPTDDGRITPEHIEKALNRYPDVKSIFLVNPNNPTGQVFNRDELKKIAYLANKHDLLVIMDEVFHKLVHDPDTSFVSLASIEVDGKLMFERTVTLRSVSKDHGLAAIRSGYAIGSKALMKKLLIDQFTFGTTFNVDDIAQYITVAALSQTPAEYYLAQKALLRRHRDLIIDLIQNINGKVGYEALTAIPTSAGMFQIVDASGLRNRRFREQRIDDDGVLCEFLLKGINGQGVAVLPGSCGGHRATDLKLRLTLSSPESDIREGFKRMSEFIDELSNDWV